MKDYYLKAKLDKYFTDNTDVFTQLFDGVFFRDLRNNNQWMSSKFWTLLGFDPDLMAHQVQVFVDQIIPDDREIFDHFLKEHLEDPHSHLEQLIRFRHATDKIVHGHCKLIVIRSHDGTPTHVIGLISDMSRTMFLQQTLISRDQEIDELSHRLKIKSVRDDLTGLYNRYVMDEMLMTEKEKADRKNRLFSVMMFNVNKFRLINDTFGHQIGDKVLKAVSEKLNELLRKQDLKSRWSGDEFLVLLPETDMVDTSDVRKKVVSAMNDWHIEVRNQKVHFTCAIGLGTYKKGEKLLTLLTRAEQDMNRHKIREIK